MIFSSKVKEIIKIIHNLLGTWYIVSIVIVLSLLRETNILSDFVFYQD